MVVTAWVRADERRPIDFDFSGQIHDDESISSHEKTVYVITDNSKSDVASTVVDAGAVTGKIVRLVFHQMTHGKVYHVTVRAVTSSGNKYTAVRLIQCGKYGIVHESLPVNGRQSYELDFGDELPAGLTIDGDNSTYSAYDVTDLGTNVIGSLKAGHLALGNKLRVYLENGTKDATYLVHVLALTDTDPAFGGSVDYLVGRTMIVRCKEL